MLASAFGSFGQTSVHKCCNFCQQNPLVWVNKNASLASWSHSYLFKVNFL